MQNLVVLRKLCEKSRCFLGKFTLLKQILHDRWSWRSRQISSLDGGDTGEGDDEVDDGNGDGKDFWDDIDGDENNFDYDDTCGAKNTLYGLKTSFSDQEHLYFWSKKLNGRRDPPQ